MKIIDIIKKWLGQNKKQKPKMIDESKTNNIENKKEFIRKIDAREGQELLSLKLQLENGDISVSDLSIFEVMDLLELYGENVF